MGFYSKLPNVSEEEGSPREEFDSVQGVLTASVRLRTPWSQRLDVASDILDNRRKWPDGRGKTPPVAFAIGIAPEGCVAVLTNEKIVYNHAILTVRYSNSPLTGLIREEVRPNSEFIKLSEQGIYWNSAANDLEDPPAEGDKVSTAEAPGFYRTGYVIIRTLNEIPLPLDKDFFLFIGTVNKDVFVLPVIQGIAAPETLLYSDPTIDIQYKADGTKTAKVVQRLIFRLGGWNRYWRTVDDNYTQMVKTKAGVVTVVRSYPTSDWAKTKIFRTP